MFIALNCKEVRVIVTNWGTLIGQQHELRRKLLGAVNTAYG